MCTYVLVYNQHTIPFHTINHSAILILQEQSSPSSLSPLFSLIESANWFLICREHQRMKIQNLDGQCV